MFSGFWQFLLLLVAFVSCSRELTFKELSGSPETDILKIIVIPEAPLTYRQSIDLKVTKKFISTSSDFEAAEFKSKAQVILNNGKILNCRISGVILTCRNDDKEASYVLSKEVQKAFTEQGVPIMKEWKKSDSKGKFKNWGNSPPPTQQEPEY